MIYIHALVIHTEELVFRKRFLISALKTIEDVCKAKSYGFNTYIIKEDSEVNVDVEKTGDNDFDSKMVPFKKTHESNFSKQHQAVQKIVELGKEEKEGDVHYYMCIEDDCVFLPQFVANLEKFLENPSFEHWDILFLCLCQPNDIDECRLVDTRELFKVLPSKECYLITVDTATKLLTCLEKMQFHYRLQLSYWIHKNPEIQSKYCTKRISIEGSKVGIMPSSVHDTNILIYNRDFIKLFNMVLGREPFDIDEATKVYNMSSHLKSPDIIHLYAVILFKKQRMEEAKELFMEAVKENILKNGRLEKNSEILNNAINICGIYQVDRDLYRKSASKYA